MTELSKWLERRGGRASVAEFMRAALQAYYGSRARDVGSRGDFSTAATLHPALGQAIAAWAWRRRVRPGPGGRHELIEIGAGGGQLARSVLATLGWRRRRRLSYRIVEISKPLRRRQRRLLRFRGVHWHDSVGEALKHAGGHALIFSNELVDAFPCHQVVFNRGRWQEIYLKERSGGVVEAAGPLSDPRIESDWCSLPRTLRSPREGQRFELHLPYLDWLRGWIDDLRSGAVLTIDYGSTADDLKRRGTAGSLRAFHGHRRHHGLEIYRRFGRQDLTADVNFTDLRHWGERLGLITTALSTQREFMLRELPELADRAVRDEALAYLLDETKAGGAFRVLEQLRVRTSGDAERSP